MKFDTLLHIFALTLRSPEQARRIYRNLNSRSGNDPKITAQLFLADEYGLTAGAYFASGYKSIDEFIKARLGARRYELAKNWNIL